MARRGLLLCCSGVTVSEQLLLVCWRQMEETHLHGLLPPSNLQAPWKWKWKWGTYIRLRWAHLWKCQGYQTGNISQS